MKKLFLLAVLMLSGVLGCMAQASDFPFIQARDFGIKGGKDGKIYQIIVKNNLSKKELVEKTVSMLQMFNLMSEDVKLDEMNDQMAQFTVPIVFNTGIGIHPADANPVKLFGNLRFEFYDGGVKLSLENLEEDFFIVTYRPELITDKGTETYQKYNEYVLKARELEKATSGMGKFFAKVDKIQEINHISGSLTTIGKNAKDQVINKINEANAARLKALTDYRDRVKDEMELFAKMQLAGEGKWFSLDSYIEAAGQSKWAQKYKKAYEWSLNGWKKAQEGNQLYAMKEKRWERDVKYVFDGIFITLAEQVEGSIEGVAEDGVQTWEREGDLVVPTDPKKKAKFVKKNKSFTDFDSYDN